VLAHGYWEHVQTTAGIGSSVYGLAAAVVGVGVALWAWMPRQRRRVAGSLLLLIASAACLLIAAAIRTDGGSDEGGGFLWMRFIGRLLISIAVINLAGVVLFDVLLSAIHLRPPAIVSDLLVAIAYVAAMISLLHTVGVNLTGILATSAVVTAVIGFSLQDTLGNVMGGMAVQVDRSIRVGDWIKVGENEGQVVQIRWRYTAVETRNWDTVLIPNSQLTKSVVTVLGRRTGQPVQHRQWVYFNVDFRHSPTEVIDTVEEALHEETIERVLRNPLPNCIMMDFKDSYGSYAVRYWLADLLPNDLANSAVRAVVFAALKRAGISPSIPAQSIFVTEEDGTRRDRKEGEEMMRRVRALRGIDLFAPLTDEERRELAGRLRTAPFVRGETIVRQGAKGDWLYVVGGARRRCVWRRRTGRRRGTWRASSRATSSGRWD
jgi:small-conductance mechanosensitive channel